MIDNTNGKGVKPEETTKKGVNYMSTTLQKWGNSLGLRIPNQMAKELGVKNGSPVHLHRINDSIVIKPVRAKPTLEELLALTKGKQNPHLDYNLGEPEGKEMI